jgi:dolichol-phosphate mannosyltransferase
VADFPVISVVIPVCNEEASLPHLFMRLRAVLDSLGDSWEIIVVDDGSTDATYDVAVDLNALDARVKLVRLSRNFGHQTALSAGLDLARGNAVVTMDGDLQHPPELIPLFLERWREGYEIVYGVMEERQGETVFKRTSARAFYRFLTWLADIDVPPGAGDFRLIDRRALDAFGEMRETNRYLRGMFSWLGFRQIGVPYVSTARRSGRSKYTTSRMVRLAANAVVGFSQRPLRIALTIGFAVSLGSILFGLSSVIVKFTGGFAVPGWASIMVLVGIVGGVQLIVLGVIGEYIARIHDEVRGRPLYVVGEARGFADGDG